MEEAFDLFCAASNEAVGAVLCQHDGDELNIIHHASRTLNEAQRNYPMAEKELFAVVFSCDKFRSYIIDSKVRVHTDRDSLKEILERTDVKPRMIRWTLLLQEFELQIMQRKEEPPEVTNSFEEILAQERVSSIYIPLGTIRPEKKFSNAFCNGFSNFLRPTIHKGKRKIMQKLKGSKFPLLPQTHSLKIR